MRPLAIVTGSSRGIGAAVAQRLSDEFTVVGLSRTVPEGVTYETVKTDVCSQVMVHAAIHRAAQRYGPPRVLVACAGIVYPCPIVDIEPHAWAVQIMTNLYGTFCALREFARHVGPEGGVIITIASTAGTRPSPGWAAYAASKAAIINLSETAAEEFKPLGIRVHCLVPGRCATALRAQLAPEEDPSTIMQPEEVADLVMTLIHGGELLAGQPLVVRR